MSRWNGADVDSAGQHSARSPNGAEVQQSAVEEGMRGYFGKHETGEGDVTMTVDQFGRDGHSLIDS